MDVIAMVVSDDDRVEPPDLSRKELLAEIRPAIDQDVRAAAFDQDRRAQAAVARLRGVALAPVIADFGDTGRRPAAQYADFQASTLGPC